MKYESDKCKVLKNYHYINNLILYKRFIIKQQIMNKKQKDKRMCNNKQATCE